MGKKTTKTRRIEIFTKHRIDDMPGYIANCDQQS